MIKHTQLKVPMTEFIVDVLVGGTYEEHKIIQKRLYDIPEEDLKTISQDECTVIDTGSDAIIRPDSKIFYLKLSKMPIEDIPTTVHELWHIMWHIEYVITDFKLVPQSSAFAAPMIEDLTRQLFNAIYEDLLID